MEMREIYSNMHYIKLQYLNKYDIGVEHKINAAELNT